MNTSDGTRNGSAAFLRPQAECSPTCACGQDLESCSRAHCPRCGSDVARVELHPEHVSAGPLGWVA